MSWSEDGGKILKRKIEHIDICLHEHVDSRSSSTCFDNVILVHKALPEVNFDEIDTGLSFLGHRFNAPLLIDAISGGPRVAYKINSSLAEVAEKMAIGMVVGSQRVAIGNDEAKKTFKVVRDRAPTAFIAANIGINQIKGKGGVDIAKQCVEMVNADALVVHLNPLQELLQEEGDRNFTGGLDAISDVVNEIGRPVIVKETGAGIEPEISVKLEQLGVSAVNLAGVGGTSWAAVEHYRNERMRNQMLSQVARTFWDWGLPTAFLVFVTSKLVRIPVISSGGIRTGVDVAKSLVLGANMAALAKPLLKHALEGPKSVEQALNKMIYELRVAMCLTGSPTIDQLRRSKYLIVGRLKELIESWTVSRNPK